MVENELEFSDHFTMDDMKAALKLEKLFAVKEVEEYPLRTQEDYIAKYNELKCLQNFLQGGFDMQAFGYL